MRAFVLRPPYREKIVHVIRRVFTLHDHITVFAFRRLDLRQRREPFVGCARHFYAVLLQEIGIIQNAVRSRRPRREIIFFPAARIRHVVVAVRLIIAVERFFFKRYLFAGHRFIIHKLGKFGEIIVAFAVYPGEIESVYREKQID